MKSVLIEDYPKICDEIRYTMEDGILKEIKFLLKEKIVLTKLADKLSGVTLESILKSSENIIKAAPFMESVLKKLVVDKNNEKIKAAIERARKK